MISLSPVVKTTPSTFSYLPCYDPNQIEPRKNTALILDAKGYEQYLPLHRSRRQWSDRIVEANQPLFPGYLFADSMCTNAKLL